MVQPMALQVVGPREHLVASLPLARVFLRLVGVHHEQYSDVWENEWIKER